MSYLRFLLKLIYQSELSGKIILVNYFVNAFVNEIKGEGVGIFIM